MVQSPSRLTLYTKFLRPLTVNKLQKHFKLKKCVPQYLIQTVRQVSVFQLHSTTTYGAHDKKKHVTKCKHSVITPARSLLFSYLEKCTIVKKCTVNEKCVITFLYNFRSKHFPSKKYSAGYSQDASRNACRSL